MEDFGSVFFLFFPMVREFHRAPVGNVTIFAFSKYAVEHSRSTEEADMPTMEWRERPAFDVIQLGQKDTGRLTVCGRFQQQVLHFVQWNAHIGQDNWLGGGNLVLNLRRVTQRLKLGLGCQRFEAAHSIQQGRISDLRMPFATSRKNYDLLVFEASRLGESKHAQTVKCSLSSLAHFANRSCGITNNSTPPVLSQR